MDGVGSEAWMVRAVGLGCCGQWGLQTEKEIGVEFVQNQGFSKEISNVNK